MVITHRAVGLLACASAFVVVACGENGTPATPGSGAGGGAAGEAQGGQPQGAAGGRAAGVGGGGSGGDIAGNGGTVAMSGSSGSAGTAGGGSGGGGSGTKATQLKDTGLFTGSVMGTLPDGSTLGPTMTLATDVHAFTPQYALWSDSAAKRRWVYMPPGKKITTDFDDGGMDYWRYPGGFKLWKEFSRDGKVIETRLLEKLGDGAKDWYMVAFVWNADYTDASATPLGLRNALGTMHDVPDEPGCNGCHGNMVDNVLGFSALQLSHALPDSLNLQQITEMGWLTASPPATTTLPGTDVEKAAFGYLHANCGHCHNTRANIYKTSADVDLWTHVNELQGASPQTLRSYLSLVCDEWPGPGFWSNPITSCTPERATGARRQLNGISQLAKRIVPGDPAMSAVRELMSLRADGDVQRQMPPIGTEMADMTALAAIDAWINSLPPE